MVMTASPRGPVASGVEERPALAEAEALLSERRGKMFLSDEQGNRVALPETAVGLVHWVIQALAGGNPVDIAVLPKELTIPEAAELLDLRPEDIVRLLDQGELPVVQAGALRRIRFEDVMAYKPKRVAARRAALAEITRLSEEMGLYDLEDDGEPPTAADGARKTSDSDSQ